MVKKKINIWYFIIGTIIVLMLIAGIKSLNNHKQKEYKVINNKILESAKECYLNNDCEGEIIIKDLYEKKYLDLLVDPNTKENLNENICIKFDGKEAIFCK